MLKFYNTLTRKKEEFKPLKNKKAGIYSCGPTVYWNQHIGNMYSYVQWDVLTRFLKYLGYKVKWVMNITDVGHMTSDQDLGEDKIEKGAKREKLTVWQTAEKYIKQFTESMDLLNIQRPDILCRATENIKEQIELIKKIEKNGFAYRTKTGLVFDTSKLPNYSKFAKLNLKKQEAGARVQIDSEKKKPWDFLLWVTNQPNHIMQWQSPWGKGFPGWHIECTAMSTKYLGKQFDIHTGGKEHIPIHHTNEIAQSCAAFGKQTANYWLHNEWLLIDGVKVSKSLGNIVLVTDLIKKGFDPLAFRYLALTSRYRQGLNFTWQSLQAAQNAILKLRSVLENTKDDKKTNKEYLDKFKKILGNDLDAPQALAVLWKLIKDKKAKGKIKTVKEMDKVLGLDLFKKEKTEIPAEIKKLIKKRETARKNKNWQKADELRKEIEDKGYKVEDAQKGSVIKKK
ncbi:cysteine--tRNA ligase [Patescibacteria group bacterium]|nr:cysteine--tRNA ligase [Patescibacteria group bacterium]